MAAPPQRPSAAGVAVRVKASFARGLLAGLSAEPDAAQGDGRREALVATLRSLSSKRLTRVMGGRDLEQARAPRVTALFWDLPFEEQRATLRSVGAFVFPVPGAPARESSDGGAGSEGSGGDPDDEVAVGAPMCMMAERGRKRKLSGKAAPHSPHLPEGFKACCPATHSDCCLARELGAAILAVDFGNAHHKPERLWRWGAGAGETPSLMAVGWRETGRVYYSEVRAEAPLSFAWLCSAMSSLEALCARMPLLLTPTFACHRVPAGVRIVERPAAATTNALGVDASDGMAEIGPTAAEALGLLPPEVVASLGPPDLDSRPAILPAWQFSTEATLAQPQLTPNPVLRLRGQALGNPDSRKVVVEAIAAAVRACKSWTLEAVPAMAWSSGTRPPPEVCSIAGRALAPPRPPPSRLEADRHAVHRVAFSICGDEAEETPLADLLESDADPSPAALRRGTKDMLQRGQCNNLLWRSSLARQPRLRFPSVAACLYAVRDVVSELLATACYVVRNGSVLVGECAVWRYPCHSVGDIEILVAIAPLATAVLPANCLVLSRLGKVTSGMAGGDLDGDLNQVCFSAALVDVVRRTQEAVEAVAAWDLEASVLSAVVPNAGTHLTTGRPKDRAAEHHSYGQSLPTGYVRGRVCACCERAAEPAIASEDPIKDGSLVTTLRLAVVAHKSLDCPKKYTQEQILGLAAQELKALRPTRRSRLPARATAAQSAELSVEPFRGHAGRVFEAFPELFDPATWEGWIGQIWMPLSDPVLGEGAGVALGWAMRQSSPSRKAYRRSVETCPLLQIGGLLRHRASHTLSGNPQEWIGAAPGDILRAMHSQRSRPLRSWRSLCDSYLP